MPNPPLASAGYMSDHVGWSAGFADTLETVADLVWPASVQTYGRMRHDPQLSAVLASYTLPIRQAPWYVDPAGCQASVAELVADDLGLPILGREEKPSAARRRGVRWDAHLRLALLHLVFGHMPFAQRYEIVDGQARLAELSERMPQTITEIETEDSGALKGVLQFGEKTSIPARNLLWYCHEREGAAWQGRSMLRPAYGAWLLKNEVWRVHATSIRRFGMGVPNVEAPQGSQPAQVLEAQRLASSMRVGDQAGVGLPPGFKLNLTGLTGSVPDALAFIRYLDGQMAKMALAQAIDLGSTETGSRALGESFVDLMLTSLNSIAAEMADTATGLSVQMVDYNFGEDEPAPRIVCADVGSRPEVTAEAINGLMQAGALSADPELEAWVRERWRLPKRDESIPHPSEKPPTPPPAPPTPAEPPAAEPKPGEPVAASASPIHGVFRRLPTRLEAAARTDFAAVQGDWERALNRLVNDWAGITRAQRTQLIAQVTTAVDAGDVSKLAGLAVDSQHAAEVLAEVMHEAADEAAVRMAGEAQDQGVPVDTRKARMNRDRLDNTAVAVAALLGVGLAASAARHALQVWSPGADPKAVASKVAGHLANLTDASLRENLGGALSIAQNTGRVAVMDTAPEATYVASEILDSNVCSSCAAVDGRHFASLAEAEETYASGGYEGCEGGLRCRGVVVAVWEEQ